MRSASYILSAKEVIQSYPGGVPFAAWVKDYFRKHKKFGSRDRKTVAHLCYAFFRLGHLFAIKPVEERIGLGLFLSSSTSNAVLADVSEAWNENAALSPKQKLIFLGAEEEWEQLFPISNAISHEIDKETFVLSHLVQPDVHIRLRPGREGVVKAALETAGIPFVPLSQNALALPQAVKLEELISVNQDAVIQDYSSQRVLQPLTDVFAKDQRFTAWDCCAASGGKSILLFDQYPKVQLTVSDVRSSILHNLHRRFSEAGMPPYRSFVCDVAAPQFSATKKYNLVLCDAPCSGSGTWGRTPEQLSFFTQQKLEYYTNLQKWIGQNAAKAVADGGYFLYCTCSVFKAENEDIVAHLQKHTALKLHSMAYVKGYTTKGDTLFTALFSL